MRTFDKAARSSMGVLIAMGALGAGCVDATDETSTEAPAPIATAALPDGGQVDFYEPEPGRLTVFARGRLGDDVADLSPVAMYEALAGTAPAALREAQLRADAARASLTPGDGEVVLAAPQRSSRAELTANDFRAQYCTPGAVDFDYCWTNSTNNYEIDISSVDWIHAHVDALSGSFTLSMYYRTTWGNWNLVFSDNVSTASSVITQSTTDNDRYLVKITSASGDDYHLSIHGDK